MNSGRSRTYCPAWGCSVARFRDLKNVEQRTFKVDSGCIFGCGVCFCGPESAFIKCMKWS